MKNFLLLHTTCWIIFILFELTSLQLMGYSPEHPFVYGLFYSLNILFFYAHIPILNILFYRPRGWIEGLLLFLVLVFAYLLFKFIISYLVERPRLPFVTYLDHIKAFLYTAFYRGFYFSVLAVFYWSATHISGFRREKFKAEARLAKVRNALLQQQISPHMLFNTLNFIYSRVYNTSEEAARCVVLLSDILRFSLDATDAEDKVQLEHELEQVKRLVEINSYRFEESAVKLEINGETNGHRIIPLVLLTLTENLFKHADLSDSGKAASLLVEVSPEGQLIYQSRNQKKRAPQTLTTGRGLENVRLRLEYAYPNRHRLTIAETNAEFDMKLVIQL